LVGAACEITISADGDAVYGKELTITVDVLQIHRTCVTPIEDTQIDLYGLSVVDYVPWQEVEPGLRRLVLTVVPNWVGQVGIEVRRECVKYGLMEKDLYLDAALGLETAQELVPQAAKLVADEAGAYQALAQDGTLLAELVVAEGSVEEADFQLLLAASPDERILGVLLLTPLDVPADTMAAFLNQFVGLPLSDPTGFEPQPMPDYEDLSQAILEALRGTLSE
jgi:hypothetical protein